MLWKLIPIVQNPKSKIVVNQDHQKEHLQMEAEEWMFLNDWSEAFLIPVEKFSSSF